MSKEICVVGAILDEKNLTLYLKGTTKTVRIPQGDARLKPAVDFLVPRLGAPGAEVMIDLDKVANVINHFEEVEKKSNGLVRFFRVAKEKVKAALGIGDASQEPQTPVQPFTAGAVKVDAASAPLAVEKVEIKDEKLASAVDEILSNARPAVSSDLTLSETSTDTVVAVVDGKVVADAQKLATQVVAVSKGKSSAKGLQKFLERVASVSHERQHSKDDLMKFMQRGDLPIADDGSIIIYKLLRRTSAGHFVDCHTGKVPQRVGSHVFMDKSLVDPNRRNECSNGLHVARRQYLGTFSGDVCVLGKVAPEDVIAVPEYDANKMRVCGYHILFELPDEARKKLQRNQPMTDDPTCAKILAKAIAGDHVGVLERVEIGGHKGTNIRVTKMGNQGFDKKQLKANNLEGAGEAKAIDTEIETSLKADAVDAKAVAHEVASKAKAPKEAKAETKKAEAPAVKESAPRGKQTLAEQGAALFTTFMKNPKDKAAAQACLDFKKAKKKGWVVLGMPEDAEKRLKRTLES